MKLKPLPWSLVYNRFQPKEEGLREALCTLGNGYVGVRGAHVETNASEVHYAGTYLAGVYNKVPTLVSGRRIYNEDLVNCPNWLPVSFRIGHDPWIIPAVERILSYRQELDFKRGILSRDMLIRDGRGRETWIRTRRIVHMAEPHLMALEYEIEPKNYDAVIAVRSLLDGTVENTGVARYRDLTSNHLRGERVGTSGNDIHYLVTRTSASKILIAQAARIRFFENGRKRDALSGLIRSGNELIGREFTIHGKRGKKYKLEKVAALYTSRDFKVKDPLREALRSVRAAGTFSALFQSHMAAWERLWRIFDVEIKGDAFAQQVVRLHTFHLLQTASPHNEWIDAGLPARGLHGEAYRGHIFWDEMFVFPLYDLHLPRTAEALIKYRYNRLNEARRYAAANGYKGAMFPWQSGSSGVEETQTVHLNPLSGKWGPDYSCIQRHVSFAIAYNVWRHWQYTKDLGFLKAMGAEILLSISQFTASLVKYDGKHGRFHTEGIMGPDEFHERYPGASRAGITDNAYSNLMIAWLLSKSKELLSALPHAFRRRLLQKLKIKDSELRRWEDISCRMNLVIAPDGIVSQFDGYFDLKEVSWEAYRKKYKDIHRMDRILKAEGKSPDNYKVSKQADYLMVYYLMSLEEVTGLFERLGYSHDASMVRKNYLYYERRCSHGSTLSKVVHGAVADQLGMKKESMRWFHEILRSDVYDTQGGTTPEGIHVGVMGGSIYFIQNRFAGVSFDGDALVIHPHLPDRWKSLRFKLCYRGNWFSLLLARKQVQVTLEQGSRQKKVKVCVAGSPAEISSGSPKSFKI